MTRLYSHPMMVDEIVTVQCQNNSGGALVDGDVVVLDKSNTTTSIPFITTTTSGNDRAAFGMVSDSIASGAVGPVQIWGMTQSLKVDGTTDIAVGDYLSTFTTAKIAQKSTGVGAFAVALEAYATNDSAGVIDAFITSMGVLPRPSA